MIQIVKRKHCLWRNMYAPRPVLMAELALDEAAAWKAAALDDLLQVLREKLPGFTLQTDAGVAHLVARLAQHFQLTRDVTPTLCGVHARDEEKHQATIFFAAMDPFLADASLGYAVQLANAITSQSLTAEKLPNYLGRCIERVMVSGLDQTTQYMLEETERRGIPWFRVSSRTRYVQLGQGCKQRRLIESMPSAESPIGRDMSRDKLLTFQILNQIGLPVGRFARVQKPEQAMKAAEQIGYPIVLKPTFGHKGDSVFAGLRNPQELRAALARMRRGQPFVLQSHFPGDDHRVLIVDGKLIAAARRIAAGVVGDGTRAIAALVEEANRDPRRGSGFSNLMNFITIDDEAQRMLRAYGRTMQSIPAKGEYVQLRSTANISTGGTALDVTNTIHPDNAHAAIRAAKAMEIKVCGVDFISTDISKSWREIGGGICEVNAIVGLRPHRLANPHIHVSSPIIDTIYPTGDQGRIPTAMITGSKGKSTTTKMLHAMLTAAGHTAAAVTTDGVVIGTEEVAVGDYAGATGASIALRDPTVTTAALEVARGGLLKSGMYLDWCNVAALTCVTTEQTGIDGIETLDDMRALKRKVLEAARDAVVLNADDEYYASLIPEFAHLRVILFSCDPASAVVRAHTKSGGDAVVVNKNTLAVHNGSKITPIIDIHDMPSTMGGAIEVNGFNAAAAAGLALGMRLSVEHMHEALKHYDNSLESAGCRFSFVNGFPFKVMFDRAAQATAFKVLLPVLKAIPVSGKRICLYSIAGNRPDWMADEGAELLAGNFDHYICFDRVAYRRGRKPGEIASNLAAALSKVGVAPDCVSIAETTEDAARTLIGIAKPDDFAAVLCADAHGYVEKFHAALKDTQK